MPPRSERQRASDPVRGKPNALTAALYIPRERAAVRRRILSVIQRKRGNAKLIAAELDVSRSTLYRVLPRFDIGIDTIKDARAKR